MKIKQINSNHSLCGEDKQSLINFLHQHLEEYTDPKEEIERSINHIFSKESPPGGFLLLSYHHTELSGVAVVNRTGMAKFVPENLLVYIAVHKDFRGLGIGKELVQQVIGSTDGNIALHVEPKNPAVFLYTKLGFENKYLEMRYTKTH